MPPWSFGHGESSLGALGQQMQFDHGKSMRPAGLDGVS